MDWVVEAAERVDVVKLCVLWKAISLSEGHIWCLCWYFSALSKFGILLIVERNHLRVVPSNTPLLHLYLEGRQSRFSLEKLPQIVI